MTQRTAKSHIISILSNFSDSAYNKYMAGQKEHGGRLWRKPLVREVTAEAIDFVIYVSTLAEQLALAKKWAKKEHATKTFNILEFGNPEGTKEKGD